MNLAFKTGDENTFIYKELNIIRAVRLQTSPLKLTTWTTFGHV